MTLTNSIIAPLPAGMALDAAKVAFENFGEVSRVQRLEKFDTFVQVVFFDVRSAGRAVKAFGAAGCIPGPQVGDRTVMLAGDDQLSTKDFQKISEVCKSKDGSFFLEFYDVRDAMRYQKAKIQLPPGLPNSAAKESPEVPEVLPPPGLAPVAAAAPAARAPASDWQVVIRNLPTKILTKVMMDAVFQQAGFDGYLKEFTIQAGAGEVVAKFADQTAAQGCVTHFSGCQWDNKSGAVVTAELFPPREAKPSKATKKKAHASASNEMSAEAPAFQPSSMAPYEFSAEAPVFMPFMPNWGYMPKVEEEVTGNPRPRNATKLAFGSDTSTEVGDSEDDDKTSPARVKRILPQQAMGARSRSGSASSSA
ncbi:unnamed protein product [Symbiodinium natans]|uniref:Uncharacterized protein n=1 Tax=Symbiodinium natans TaxID=878477 RepID=A0A812NCD3_9DINO|nr:unnamed protein product [Symbiodinium natans]